MYELKQIPEDFIVKELSNVQITDEGRFTYFTLIKKKYTTQRAIEQIARVLKVRVKDIGFAGTKDKYAITYQTISVKGKYSGNREIDECLKLVFLGHGDDPISLGDLHGNAFIIVVRNLDNEKITKSSQIPNYFDVQRFSSNNIEIGMNIIRGNFKKAVSLIVENNDDYNLREYLEKQKNNFVGAIKKLPYKIQRFYVNSVQSFIFNEILRKKINGTEAEYSFGKLGFSKEYDKIVSIPLVGYGTKSEDKDLTEVLNELKLVARDFIVRPMPDLSAEGDNRDGIIDIENLVIGTFEEDELNKGKKKVKIMFNLQKGAYATVAIKQLFFEELKG